MTEDIRCDCCGVRAELRPLTITFSRDAMEASALCEMCDGLIDAGLLRLEIIDGQRRYRQWHPQPMERGELLPYPHLDAGLSE